MTLLTHLEVNLYEKRVIFNSEYKVKKVDQK